MGGYIGHLTRVQVAQWLVSDDLQVTDPDESSLVDFAGDVFQYPISEEVLEEMAQTVGL